MMMTTEQLAACRVVRHEPGSKVVFVDAVGTARTLRIVHRDGTRDFDLVSETGGENSKVVFSGSERDCADLLDDAAHRMGVAAASVGVALAGKAPGRDPEGIRGSRWEAPTETTPSIEAPRPAGSGIGKRLGLVAGFATVAVVGFAAGGGFEGHRVSGALLRAPAVIGGEMAPSGAGPSDLEAMASIADTPIDERRLGADEAVRTASASPASAASPAVAASPLLIDGEPAPEPGKGDEGIAVKTDDPTMRGPAPAQPAVELPSGGTLAERATAAKADAATRIEDAKAQVASAGPEKATADLATMQEALRAVQNGEKLDPAILERLPVDIARKLKEQGALLDEKESALVSGRKLSEPLVTLSDAVVADLKDADGVSTVPTTNFWAATGGNVRLPLPGGGDIVDPAMFADFGL